MPDKTAFAGTQRTEHVNHAERGRAGRRRFCATLGGAAMTSLGFGLGLGLAAGDAEAAGENNTNVARKNADSQWAEVRQIVDAASRPGLEWRGPTSGPRAMPGKSIALWADNLRNGGVLGAAVGVREAVRQIGWSAKLFHSEGSDDGMASSLSRAAASGADGIIVLAGDHRKMAPHLRRAAEDGKKIVGWHVAPLPGPIAANPIAMNISTDPLEVARVTALAALLPNRGDIGAIVFTDNSIELARVKSEQMLAVIRAAGGTILEVIDMPLTAVPQRMREMTRVLLARYGPSWTHALAINDLYFDYAVAQLTTQGHGMSGRELNLLSAGDGSASAILRIMAGSFQTSTVAEPLNLHGWQLVDELNRLFAGAPPSNYLAPAHLLTLANIGYDGGPRMMYDPDNGYRDAYRNIWRPA
ncbi:MAG TPA: substrate-binding domain-containing protein [Herbaspirillum sp.]